MYCSSCGNEIAVELKYCNRCGANLSLPATNTQVVQVAPVKLGIPSVVLGATIIFGLLITILGVIQMSTVGVPAVAVVWMLLFAVATLFGCSAMMIRFWTKLISMQRENVISAQPTTFAVTEKSKSLSPASSTRFQNRRERSEHPVQQLPPRLDGVPSVTENTTRTLSAVYSEAADPGTKEY